MFFINFPAKLLKYYYGLGLSYNYYIKKPKLSAWYKVVGLENEQVILEDSRFPLKKISALVVSYASGELLDQSGKGSDFLPKGVEELRESDMVGDESIEFDELDQGGTVLEVKMLSNRKHPRKEHYITEITNNSEQAIKVTKFSGYILNKKSQAFEKHYDSFYTQEQFNEWFNVQNEGWIEPGETVREPNNYGSGDAYWVYFCKNREGKSFIVGSRMPLKN